MVIIEFTLENYLLHVSNFIELLQKKIIIERSRYMALKRDG